MKSCDAFPPLPGLIGRKSQNKCPAPYSTNVLTSERQRKGEQILWGKEHTTRFIGGWQL